MEEQKVKEKIIALYKELEQEKDGRYLPGTGFRYKDSPSGSRYAEKAKELLDNAIKLAEIDPNFSNIYELFSTINKEVELVRNYSYKYDKNRNPTPKSIAEMQQMMADATDHIYRYFVCKFYKR
ncbi:hypothetical protein [Prevotella sp.]|uniref:hypothetical protein n=1 Tax=Prevotella sp. TaxID=59823 RepID=UPI002E771592|nr:hypothetical protein [Prevotella sp.]MEE0670138.1 hypothetical protein [Prevotella sp.]